MVILCTIDLETREVSIPSGQCIAAYDHNVDVIRFQAEAIPGFSLDTSSIKIAAQGPNKNRHDYAVDPSTVSIEEETGYITFDWPIPVGVTEMPIGTFKYGDKGNLIFSVCAEIISGSTLSKAWHSDDGIITVVAHLEPEAGGGEDPEEEATNAQKIAQLQTDVAVINTQVDALGNGSPKPARTVAEMTEHDKVYLYTGSETGYTAGNWYFWNGSAWTSGGTYGGTAVTDTTLSISGAAADAKAVGDALSNITIEVDNTLTEQGKAADAKAVGDAIAEKADADDVGDLSQLTTTAKDSLVSAINEVNERLDDVNANIGITNVQYTSVSGTYINLNGVERSSALYSHTNPFAVSKGNLVMVKATGYLTNVAMIATCNADLSNISVKVVSTDSTNRVYKYLCDADCYVVVSYLTASGAVITLKSAESNEQLDSRLTEIEAIEDVQNALVYDSGISVLANGVTAERGQPSKYVNKNGGVSNSNNFYITSPIAMQKGQTIRFNCKGYLTEVAMLASVEDGVYTPLIISADNDEHILTYTCIVDMNVVISCIVTVTTKYSVYASQIGLNNARITALEHDFVAFATMGVIGDSLASGASNYSGGASDRPIYSWGKSIEREHGIDVTLFSYGGATTRSWLSDGRGATALSNANVLECYIIGLGVNDAYFFGADYLGSTSDIHVGSESENTDTYYGNYSKIIATIKAKSPRAKIFCLTNPKGTDEVRSAYNQAVKDIVSLYSNTYLVDLLTDPFYTSKIFTNTWYSAHSTALGYKLIGANIYAHISEFVQTHVSDFTNIQWIVENHP